MSEAFACLVGIGLLVEYGDEIIDCFAKQHLPSIPLFGGLLVTAGVFGEVFFSRLALITTEELQERADSDVAQANKQAAEAFDRAARAEQAAAEANLESDRLRQELADRMVSADGRGAMLPNLPSLQGNR